MNDNLQDPVFDGTQTSGTRVWFGVAADAYAAGEREGAAAERERILLALLGCETCGEYHAGRRRYRNHRARIVTLTQSQIADLIGGTP